MTGLSTKIAIFLTLVVALATGVDLRRWSPLIAILFWLVLVAHCSRRPGLFPRVATARPPRSHSSVLVRQNSGGVDWLIAGGPLESGRD
jgi:hypothetical protein